MDRLPPEQLKIDALGPRQVDSPLPFSTVSGDGVGNFVRDDERVLHEIVCQGDQHPALELTFQRAGPREKIFFQPDRTTAAIVTCGGLCPGLNNVIRAAYYELRNNYGVSRVLGIRHGYRGLNPACGQQPLELTDRDVEEIHKLGGTILGTSRGSHEPSVMVDFLETAGIDILICVGGDGTQRGARAIVDEVSRRKRPISVVGIPKTIDNDIAFVERSFGFDTAVEKALEHITGAHVEAVGVPYGIGLVKLMGRHAGFIATNASLASGQVDFVLIPEVPICLAGQGGFLERLERCLKTRQHAVVVVAEGAGQELFADQQDACDASGNPRLQDIGLLLKTRIAEHFQSTDLKAKIKYFDPSYHIRSRPANCSDALLSNKLARRAVHAAMAGKTDMLVGLYHNMFVHVPLRLVTSATKRVDPEGEDWMGVLASSAHWMS